MKNYNIAAKKKKDDILFLRKIVRGGADQSYGIEVAKLAGVPEPVLRRARKILEELEAGVPAAPAPAAARTGGAGLPAGHGRGPGGRPPAGCGRERAHTPIEAMNLLYELKQML